MKNSLWPSALPGVLEKFHPPARSREVFLPEPDDGSVPLNAYLGAIRKAHREDCIILPPGNYPAPKLTRSLVFRAARPGTVRFRGSGKGATIRLDGNFSVWFQGIHILPGSEEDLAVEQSRGCLIFSNCHISGGMKCTGKESLLFLENSRLDEAEVGLQLTNETRAELMGCAISGCTVGIAVEKSSSLSLLHSRIEGAFREESENPGAGLHAESSKVYAAGTLFIENQLAAHFLECGEVEMLFCEFERQVMGGLMMQGGGPLRLHGCVFAEQASKDYAHVTLDRVTSAAVDFCSMDASAGLNVQSTHGHLTQRSEAPQPSDSHGDALSSVLREIQQEVGMGASKPVMETLLHQAHAAIQRRKLGMPVPPLKFHCIFEGEEGSGRHQAAVTLAKSLATVGILSSEGKVVECDMEDLLVGNITPQQAIQPARGGLLYLHAPVHVVRKEPRHPVTKIREILRAVLSACGEDTVLVFSGTRDNVRPILRNSADTEELFRATLSFSLPSPPELAEMFHTMAASLHIRLTTKARMKLLLALHMLHDRKDRRFLNHMGVAKLLDATQKRYFERCSRERNFDLPLEAGDLDVSVEKAADAVLVGHPVFVIICPECGCENPWIPGQPSRARCVACEHSWETGWGIWKPSSHYRRLKQEEATPTVLLLPPHRGRLAISG